MKWNFERFWDDPPPGTVSVAASEGDISSWESKHKLSFPALLRDFYLRQNGGRVRYCDLLLNPIEQMTWPGSEMHQWIQEANLKLADASRVVVLSNDPDNHTVHLLEFPDDDTEPLVHSLHFFSEIFAEAPELLSLFLWAHHGHEDKASVDWREIGQMEVLHRESFLMSGEGEDYIEEFVFGRLSGKLVLFSRIDQDFFFKLVIDEPLNVLEATIEQQMPRPQLRYVLYAVPENQQYLKLQSLNLEDGYWQNQISHETEEMEIPSATFQTLKELRVTLLGVENARLVVRKQRRELIWVIFTASIMLVFCFPFLLILVVLSMIFRILGYPIRRFRNRSSSGSSGSGGDGPVIRVKPE